MASTVKLPIAIYLLHLAQHGRVNLDKMVTINEGDLVPYSGYMGYYLTRPGLAMSIYNMLEPMITISDNTASDKLLKIVGGPYVVQKFLERNGVSGININRHLADQFIEAKGARDIMQNNKQLRLVDKMKIFNGLDKSDLAKSYKNFFSDENRDSATPMAMTLLIEKLYKGELLNKEYTELMLEIMGRAMHGCIGNLLHNDVKIAHKTGTWGYANYSYTHDVGIITTQDDANHIIISVYTASSDGKSSALLQKKAIAEVSKLIYTSALRL